VLPPDELAQIEAVRRARQHPTLHVPRVRGRLVREQVADFVVGRAHAKVAGGISTEHADAVGHRRAGDVVRTHPVLPPGELVQLEARAASRRRVAMLPRDVPEGIEVRLVRSHPIEARLARSASSQGTQRCTAALRLSPVAS